MILLVTLFSLIFILILAAFRVFYHTQLFQKIATKSYLDMQEQIAIKTKQYEQVASKNNYLENYNVSLLKNLFQITQELLTTKKIILEERYN
tara:strand:- start:28862 stop:29137 length:276 start_codon:yes stop_codon:yes gene_type:complete